jgi:Uma2 family endonuclease
MFMQPITLADWTVARLHALPDDGNRYEIIDGELYVTPAPLFRHQIILGRLHVAIFQYADQHDLDVLLSPADIAFSDRTLVQPDLFAFPRVQGKTIEHYDDIEQLWLVVEVLSKSTSTRDRTVKRRLYSEQRIPEYWIVDGSAQRIERWRPDAQEPEILTDWIEWHPNLIVAPLRIDLRRIFSP